jgi:Raf kinase inhibitor-like YbhB/YbcL family protein
MRRAGFAAVLLLVALAAAASTAGAGERAKMRLTSPAFQKGDEIPDGFTCDRAGASPPLRIRGVPAKTRELALTGVDPDAPLPGGFVHWVVFGIDPSTDSFPEQGVPEGVVEGRNGANSNRYLGPCPPPGDDPHRYRFTLYALSEPLDLTPDAGLTELRAAIDGKVLARARLVGTYQRATDTA